MENEIWRKIEGYDKYEVSNLGRVRSLWRSNQYGHKKDSVSILCQHSNGVYLRVGLTKNNKTKQHYVARLVANAFPEICGEHFEGAEVNHKNEITTDNRAENLEWCTPSYNCIYGTRNKRIKEKLSGFGKEVRQYTKNGDLVRTYKDVYEVVELNPDFILSFIESVLRGGKHRHSAYGFKWSGGAYEH